MIANDPANDPRSGGRPNEVLSRMSHELRTPQNAVLGFSQLLRMDAASPLKPAQTEWVRHIENAETQLLAMINDVLDLSRIESGSMPLSLDTVSVALAVDEALALVSTLAADGEVQIRVEPHRPDQPMAGQVRADHLRLRQVLVNLIGNAVKYKRRGGTVVIDWRPSANAARIEVEVRDTGLGMSPEQLAHLFEPFSRLGAEATSIAGTGIGLVISHRLVQTMGGELEVSSEKGVGSCFRVSLPAAAVDAMLKIAAETGAPISAFTSLDGLHTVLYADDNALNVEVVLAVLRIRPGLRVVVARNGREAITVARRERPDLLLLDMHLGDISGLEVMQTLALDPALAQRVDRFDRRLKYGASAADAPKGSVASDPTRSRRPPRPRDRSPRACRRAPAAPRRRERRRGRRRRWPSGSSRPTRVRPPLRR